MRSKEIGSELLSALTYFVLALLTLNARADQALDSQCDERWSKLSAAAGSNYNQLLSFWTEEAARCRESQRYLARLALIDFFLDRPADGKVLLSELSAAQLQAEPLNKLALLLIDGSMMKADPTHGESAFASLEARTREYVKENPNDLVGASLLGDLLSEMGQYDSAIDIYVRVLNSMKPSPKGAGILRNLTITYSEAGRYQEAYDAASMALAQKHELVDDLYFVCAIARAQAAIGKIDGAKNSLTLLATKHPDVRADSVFRSAVQFVTERASATP